MHSFTSSSEMPMASNPSDNFDVEHQVEQGYDSSPKHTEKFDIVPAFISEERNLSSPKAWPSIAKKWFRHNFEERGIRRVEPHERQDLRKRGYLQVALMWWSVNLCAINITLGILGPTVFYLSFTDAALTAVFGALVGSLPVAYVATFGPQSGLRTLVFARYVTGWWPAKLIALFNIISLIGYGLVDAVAAGQILSAVSPNASLSVAVGIVIVCIITWVICMLGYEAFHHFERYIWVVMGIVMSILSGVAGPHFDTSTPSQGDARTIAGNRLSFFGLSLAAAILYIGEGADYIVYFPEKTSKRKIAIATIGGLVPSFAWSLLLGIGLGSGVASNPDWAAASATSQGALIVQGFSPLGRFGSFCSVLVAICLVSNMVVPSYSSGIQAQILGRWPEKVHRAIWTTVATVIYFVCALAGRNYLATVFTNFLALMGYWAAIWTSIILEEHLIFRRGRGFDWSCWNDRSKLPLGIAAFAAFAIGWAGAVLCMAQVYYVGPIAKLISPTGGDLGNYVGFAWSAIIFPPLRMLELRWIGR